MNHAGALYGELAKSNLDEEGTIQESLEKRGAGVVTVATTLASLIFTALAIAKSATAGLVLSDKARLDLKVAAVLLVVSAVLGTLVQFPRKYIAADPAALMRLTDKSLWDGDQSNAGRRIAQMQVKVLSSARDRNTVKGQLLAAAMIVEALAVGAIAYAISQVI